jgi:hypothetical protein
MSPKYTSKNTDILVGGLSANVEYLEKKVEALENKTKDLENKIKQIDSLIFWNRTLWTGIISCVVAFAVWVISILWHRPELWVKLVEFLK